MFSGNAIGASNETAGPGHCNNDQQDNTHAGGTNSGLLAEESSNRRGHGHSNNDQDDHTQAGGSNSVQHTVQQNLQQDAAAVTVRNGVFSIITIPTNMVSHVHVLSTINNRKHIITSSIRETLDFYNRFSGVVYLSLKLKLQADNKLNNPLQPPT